MQRAPFVGSPRRSASGWASDCNTTGTTSPTCAGSAVEENGEPKHGAVENLLIGAKSGPAPEVLITADGDFSDWEKVPASEMTVATVPDDAYYKAGKVAKVYAGETYVNFYVEYEDSAEQPCRSCTSIWIPTWPSTARAV